LSAPSGSAPEFYRLPKRWSASADPDPRAGEQRSADGAGRFHVGGNNLHAGGNIDYQETLNFHVHIDAALKELSKRSIRTASSAIRGQSLEHVVPPPRTNLHLEALKEHRILVLRGDRRTGLTTTSTHRWHSFAEKHELKAVKLNSTDLRELDDELERLDQRMVLLLDISHNPEFEEALPVLVPSLLERLEKHDSYLVVAVEKMPLANLPEDLNEAFFEPIRLEPKWVFDRFFERRPEDFRAVLRSVEFRELLEPAWPPLARTMADLLNRSEPDLTPAKFRTMLHHERGDAPEALEQMTRWQLDATGRSMLVAASLLDGSSPRVLAAAARDLLAAEDDRAAAGNPFDERGIRHKIEMIGTVFHAGRLGFRDPAVGDAVLPFIWEEFPSWREPLQRWLDELLTLPPYLAGAALPPLLPSRLFEFAAATDEASLIIDRIPAMAESGAMAIRHLAAALLAAGAISPTIGQAIRRKLYVWSLSGSSSLQLVATAACRHEDYLGWDPRSALVRIRHLADADHAIVRKAANQGILDAWQVLAPADYLDFLGDCLEMRAKALHDAIPELFLAVCADEDKRLSLQAQAASLVTDTAGRAERFWRLLLERATPSRARQSVHAWISVAAGLPVETGNAMAALLGTSASGDHHRIGKLVQAVAAVSFDDAPHPRERELAAKTMDHLLGIEVPLR
jgi:hypothetical protein